MIDQLRDSLAQLDVPERPPLAAIVERGRRQRRRHRARLAGIGVTAVAVGAVIALGLTGTRNPVPRSTSSRQSSPRTLRTTAFTLVGYADGRVKLTLTNSQVFDPPVLRRALAHDRIPALVERNVYCYSTPAPPDRTGSGCCPFGPARRRLGFVPKALLKLHGKDAPRPDLKALVDHTVTAIDPARMPAGTELAFDYAPGERLLAVDLVYTSSHVCRSGRPPAR